MTQLSPTSLYYDQAIDLIKNLKKSYENNNINSPHQITAHIQTIIYEYINSVGAPTTTWNPIVQGEPPLSEKMNKFWDSVSNDIANIQQEVELLNSSTIFSHNLIKTELLKAKQKNDKLNNKLKTLQLYSTVQDSNVIVFGDFFKSNDFTDTLLSALIETTGGNHIALAKEQTEDLMGDSIITVLDTSNGFIGNNQEVTVSGEANTEQEITFIGSTAKNEELEALSDNNPITWFEYEHNYVEGKDRASAKNYNFVYTETNGDSTNKINWANGPDNGTLVLNLEIDLESINTINQITYSPFGLVDNKNNPVLIRNIAISTDRTSWAIVGQTDVWVGTNTSVKTITSADNITIGEAVWGFAPSDVRYIRIQLVQKSYLESKIGHLYYEEKPTTKTTKVEVDDPDNPGETITRDEVTTIDGKRVEGPNPPLKDTFKYNIPGRTNIGDLVQKREYFHGKRWAIGIRDIFIGDVSYVEEGTYVSKPFHIDGLVDRLTIESDYSIPEGFDITDEWVKFYISPNDGLTWYQISPVDSNFSGIPEVMVFNDPIPEVFKEETAAYYNITDPVDSIRVKIELLRPTDNASGSPRVDNYKLRIIKR